MGATLPILGRYLVSRPWELGGVGLRLGTLYAINLFGAVTGVVPGRLRVPAPAGRAGHQPHRRRLQPHPGRRRPAGPALRAPAPSTRPAWTSWPPSCARPTGRRPAARHAAVTPAARRVVLAGFALSGLTAMTLQVLWTRALAVVLGSSIFSFTLILLAFLVGLGAGSAVFGRLADRDCASPVRALALLHLGIVGCRRAVLPDHRRAALRVRLAGRPRPAPAWTPSRSASSSPPA